MMKYIFLRRTNVAGYKVEICGVNTAALPLLKTEEKELLLKKSKMGIHRHASVLLTEICALF